MLTHVENPDGKTRPSRTAVLGQDGLVALAAEMDRIAGDLSRHRIAPSGPDAADGIPSQDKDFETGIGSVSSARQLADLMRDGDLLSAHARCFGYFNPTPLDAAVLADLVVAARNPQLAVTSHAPASVAIERSVIAYMARRASLPDGAGGHFTSGGSEANATAVQIALSRAEPGFGPEGVSAFSGPPRIYVSSDSHLAWIKIVRAAGLGTSAVRLVPASADGVMDIAALRQCLAEDRAAGLVPVMIGATAGTTNAGMIDPLAAIADVAAREGLHLHVDAAWAGALVLDDQRRDLLTGIERADSITIDAHKWLSVPMGAGMILVRDPANLRAAFDVATGYMPAGDGADPYVTTFQWSRRFIGARLWTALRAIGRQGYQAMFDREFALADRLRAGLRDRGWTVRNKSALPVILFDDPEGRDSQAIADWLEADGEVWLGRVDFSGHSVLRACITSFLADDADIDVLLERLDAARGAVQPSR